MENVALRRKIASVSQNPGKEKKDSRGCEPAAIFCLPLQEPAYLSLILSGVWLKTILSVVTGEKMSVPPKPWPEPLSLKLNSAVMVLAVGS